MYYNQLTTQEKTLIETQISNNGRSTIIAYLLWGFGGTLGLHRFYIKQGFDSIGFIQLILTIAGWLTLLFLVGFFFLFISGTWVFIDAFLIPDMIKEHSSKLREELSRNLLEERKND